MYSEINKELQPTCYVFNTLWDCEEFSSQALRKLNVDLVVAQMFAVGLIPNFSSRGESRYGIFFLGLSLRLCVYDKLPLK